MRRHIVYLMNPVSGTGDKSRLRDLLSTRTLVAGVNFEFQPTKVDGHYPELEARILNGEVTDIGIAGGDGSINRVVSALRHTGVPFGIIPLGSGNGLAYSAGIPADPARAVDCIIQGRPTALDAFLINQRFSCMLSGIGFDAQVAHDFSKQRKRGLLTYIRVAAGHFFTARPYPFTLDIGGRHLQTEAFLISIANSNQFGNQFTIAPKAQLNDGKLDIVVVKKMNKLQLLLSVMHQLRYGDVQERIFSRKNILYFQSDRLSIGNPALAPLHIDGDPAQTEPNFNITVIPSAFRMILPAN